MKNLLKAHSPKQGPAPDAASSPLTPMVSKNPEYLFNYVRVFTITLNDY